MGCSAQKTSNASERSRHTMTSLIPCGDFKTGYSADTTIFPTTTSRNMVILGAAVLCLAPLVMDKYALSLLIQIGYLGIAALGLNILVGFTGQISIGHAAFFGFGAFTSAWLVSNFHVPVFFAIPLAGILTTAVGMIFGLPAARLKGLYLAIATLAAQVILQDFFARASWFSGGVAGTLTEPFSIFGYVFDTDERYFYVVLAYVHRDVCARDQPDADTRRQGADRRARLLPVGRNDGHQPDEVPNAVVRHFSLLCRNRRRALCPLPSVRLGRGLHDPVFDPVPWDDHHRRTGLHHGIADGHRVHGPVAGKHAVADRFAGGRRHRPGARPQQQPGLPARDGDRRR